MIVASASRRARSQAARGKVETSGTLGRKSKRGAAGERSGGRGRVAAGGGRVGDARPRALAQAQVALGGELAVGVDDDAAGDAELAREVAGRRHARAGLQRAVADRAPELVLDLRAERGAGRPATPRAAARAADWSRPQAPNWIFHLHQ